MIKKYKYTDLANRNRDIHMYIDCRGDADQEFIENRQPSIF